MTREETITVLKAFMENPLFSEIHKAAFNIAIHDIKQRHDWDINKLMLVPKTEWEQEPTTKNDLGVDCILRADVNQVIEDYMDEQYHVLSDRTRERAFGANAVKARINELPSVTPQEPVLDKIRTEIEQLSLHKAQFLTNDNKICIDSQEVLNIIDKYKAESEE